MYESAFLNMAYEEAHPDEYEKIQKLKDVIAKQIPLVRSGLE